MSWSFSAIGTPDKIVEALQAESQRLIGNSKIEFDAAAPHLIALAKQNFSPDGPGPQRLLLKLNASGSGTSRNISGVDTPVERSCAVSIERFYSQVLI